jgi:predicted CXXCH cytochrome family protein
MSKVKFGVSFLMTLLILSMFSVVTFAARPAAPEVTTKLLSQTSVELSWNTVEGATQYKVYWNGASSVRVNGTSKGFENLTAGTYSYMVSAINADGESPKATGEVTIVAKGLVKNDGSVGVHKTHGDFQNNTNACGNCHSTHQGDSATLLKFESAEYDMCLSCHDGTLGFYNVKAASGAGTFGDFEENSHESLSMHNVQGQTRIDAAPGALTENEDALTCSSCHNPHGTENDRLLKSSVNGDTYTTDRVDLELQEDPAYTAFNASTGENGLKIKVSQGLSVGTNKTTYSKFCSTCHTDYLGGSGGQNVAGHYGHTTNSSSAGRNCASCHYAHGTDITLLKDTAGKTVADYIAGGWTEETALDYMRDVSAGGSALKKYTNMSVCWTCHTSSHAIDTPMPEQNGDPSVGVETGDLWNYKWSSHSKKYYPTFNEKANIK